MSSRSGSGCAVRALDPAYCLGAEGLGDGEVVAVDGLELRVVTTPGHTADSISFVLPAEGALLTGDMVLGRGTTVVAHPDGQLGAYFDSIERMRALAAAGEVRTVWPGHGPVLDDALGVLDFYLAHRASGWRRSRRRSRRLRVTPHPEASPRTSCPGRSSRSSTPTSTSPLGRRRAVGPRPAGLPRRPS